MNIQFLEPFNRAWKRMTFALFRPFDLHKWFVVGFNAFLAGLMSGTGGSGGSNIHKNADLGEFFRFPATAWAWLHGHPGWAMAILFAGLVGIAVLLTLTWLSSRGIFMFMSSVVHDRVEIAKPWREYQPEGNSLFVWRVLFGVFSFVLFGALLAFFFIQGGALYEAGLTRYLPWSFLLGFGLVALGIALVWGYIALFLKEFVSALMFKHRITAGEAWRRFLTLFKAHALPFIGFGLITFLLVLVLVAAVIFFVLGTCCIGGILLAIPYISTVVLLPALYAYRAFGLEFLGQFGPDYDVFPTPVVAEPAPVAPVPPAAL